MEKLEIYQKGTGEMHKNHCEEKEEKKHQYAREWYENLSKEEKEKNCRYDREQY